jgi:sulfopyruvate decarboxylase subunit alpha
MCKAGGFSTSPGTTSTIARTVSFRTSVPRSTGDNAAVPVSQTSSEGVYAALKAAGIGLVSALPETWLVHLIRMAEEDPEMILVRLAKEEEGVGVSMGAHFAGIKSAMLMQNHGLFASVNGIVSGAMLYRMPLVMLISDRGHLGERDSWQTEGGKVTRRVLDSLGIVRDDLVAREEIGPKVAKAVTLAHSSLSPVALLLSRDLMWEEPAA